MNRMIANRYEIKKSLGEGGMADVYLAHDQILNRDVAIKILRGDLSNDPITLLRFQREAAAVSKLSHPNVVEIYDVGQHEKRHYIVMEYIPGKTLKQLILLRGALDKGEAVDLMRQLVSAVAHAHENNIIHRDIKPQNVLVKDDGTVKITDFGIALAHDAVQLTQSDSVLGSAHYLAPETTRGEQATCQIDIYALGIVFYEMLRGQPPFKGENPVQIAMMHLKEEVPSILEFNPSLPQSIDNIIKKATVKNRSQRYATANEMLLDLERCLLPAFQKAKPIHFEVMDSDDKTIVLERSGKPQKVEPEEVPKPPRSKMQTIIGILLITISVVSSAALIYFSGVMTNINSNKPQNIPDVANMSLIEATELLTNLGFTVSSTVREELSDTIPTGNVIFTNPAIGSSQIVGTTIQLTVSKGAPFVIGNYVGKSIDEVEQLLSSLNISISKEYRPTKDSPFGTVLEQSILLPETKIDPTKAHNIKFVIASNPEFVIPRVKGLAVEEAAAQLRALGADVKLVTLPTDGMSEEEIAALEKGVVIDTNPTAGSLYIQNYGQVITIYYY
ncbi:MAG: Stk1 family PASTA domain-containing Ser/Thr kinase [Erysipelotrichaceae bacterium]